jgi:hypothetical protein
VRAISTCIQRRQKALTQMNIRLANVISDLSGWTGVRIVRAILAGERDPHALAALSHPGIHASRDTIAKSLDGTWQPELVFVLHQEVTMYDAYEQRIAECDRALQDHLKGFTPQLDDTGPDAEPAPTPAPQTRRARPKRRHHFASWLGLCPDNRITGGHVIHRGTRHVVNRAATALRIGATTLLRSQSDLGAPDRRFRGKLGAPKAITAMAHKLARLV